MLEQLRRQSRSFLIWIMFGIIIAVFIISFGPQAKRNQPGCGQAAQYAMNVGDDRISINSWRFAMNGLKGRIQDEGFRRQVALDLLVERDLLSHEAEQRGFRASNDLVNKTMAAGDFYTLGFQERVRSPEFWSDFKRLQGFANSLGLTSVTQLADEEKIELLAEMMRHIIMSSAMVSEDEVRHLYIVQDTTVTADYVKFDIDTYKKALRLGPDDLARFASQHEKQLKKAWNTQKAEWASAHPRVLARHIFIAVKAPDESTDAIKDPKKKKAAQAAARKAAHDAAKAAAEAARARITGGEDFAKVAGDVSDDKLTRSRGGLMGWRPADSLGYGTEVVEAVKKLKAGDLSQVIETKAPAGFHIIQVEKKSDKALTFDDKKLDLAARMAPDYYARALARRDAEKALADAQNKPLDQLFQRAAPTGMPVNGNMKNIPPELLEQLEKKGLPPPPKNPAGAKDQGSAGGAAPSGKTPAKPAGTKPAPAKPAPAKPAGTKPAPAKPAPAKPAGAQGVIIHESDNILAATGGTAGDSADKGTGKDSDETDAPPPDEVLPQVTVTKPSLESVGPTSRASAAGPGSVDFLAGVGHSKKLLGALFDTLQVGSLGPQVYEVTGPPSDGFVVIQLKDRHDADMTKFDGVKDDLTREIEAQKGVQQLSAWLQKRCNAAAKKGQIRVNRRVVEAGDKAAKFSYSPCATLGRNLLSARARQSAE